jgi:hypothetical protein
MIHTTKPNSSGRSFNVRLVRTGDKFGRNDCLTYDKQGSMIEFYDTKHAGSLNWGERGQFVARYYLTTLAERIHPSAGLVLNGGVSCWHITGEEVQRSLSAALLELDRN